MNKLQISPDGLALIKKWEGLRLKAYRDPVGIWTIGYGTTKGVVEGMEITEETAELLLLKDLLAREDAVNLMITAPLTQYQFDPLVSFCYNLGIGALRISTLRRKLNLEDYAGAAAEFLRWNKGRVNGRLTVLPGLTARREDERAMFEGKYAKRRNVNRIV